MSSKSPMELQGELVEAITRFPRRFTLEGTKGVCELSATQSSSATLKAGSTRLVVVFEEDPEQVEGTYTPEALEEKVSETKPKKRSGAKPKEAKAPKLSHYDYMRRLILDGATRDAIFKTMKERFRTARRGSHKNATDDASIRTRISLIKRVTRDKFPDVETYLQKQEAKESKEEKGTAKEPSAPKKAKKGTKKAKKKAEAVAAK